MKIKFQDLIESSNRLLKEKDEEASELKLQLAEAKNMRFNNQELHDALIHDFKKTISVVISFIYFYLFII
jgi:hypothetical protein